MDSVYEGEKRMSKMTLDEAISHAKELSEDQCVCELCREEHKQLAGWLEELKQYKSKECKTSAREIFEALGYKYVNQGTSILYIKDSGIEDYRCIKFYCRDFTFVAADGYNYSLRIDLELFDAIQTQIRELGWI